MASGPFRITRDATVAEMDAQGNLVVLRQGTNQWVCFPGDENKIGNVPMCADPMGRRSNPSGPKHEICSRVWVLM
jgi:hypothetical protein